MNDREYREWYCKVYIETFPTVERAGRRLLAHFCYALIPELDDLIQDVYLVMYKKREKLVDHENITGWLIVALKYVILKRMRAWARRRDAVEKLKFQVEAVSRDLNFDDQEEMNILRAALGEENYELLKAYHVDGVPVEELAARVGKSVGAVHTRLSRLRKRCNDILSGSGLKTMIALWMAMHILRKGL